MIFSFHEDGRKWIPGRFKHVSVIAHQNGAWAHVSVDRWQTTITPFFTLDDVDDHLSRLTSICELIQIEPESRSWSFGMPFSCVSFAAHAAGIRSCALFPDGLRRDLLRNGGEIIHGRRAKNRRVERAAAKPSAG